LQLEATGFNVLAESEQTGAREPGVAIDHPGRVTARQEKLRLIAQHRQTLEATTAQRQTALVRGMISSLGKAVSTLNASIEAELECARVRDPSHFAFPIAIRAMMVRRDNLKASIAALSKRLADVDQVSSDLFAA
jgi:uncharacterized metal-binding protein YceD (DUF177 family)